MRHCRDTQRHDKSHSQHELAIWNSAWSPARSAEARADLLVSIYCCRRYSPHSSVATSAWPTMSVHSSLGAAGGPQLQLLLDAPVSRARILTHRRAPPRLRAASLPVEFFDIHTRIDTVFLFFSSAVETASVFQITIHVACRGIAGVMRQQLESDQVFFVKLINLFHFIPPIPPISPY